LDTGFNIKGKSTDEGAKTSIYLSVSDEVKNVSGKYFDNLKEAPYNPSADDINLRKELWRVSEELTNIDSAKFLN
jgi:hypothetical protein